MTTFHGPSPENEPGIGPLTFGGFLEDLAARHRDRLALVYVRRPHRARRCLDLPRSPRTVPGHGEGIDRSGRHPRHASRRAHGEPAGVGRSCMGSGHGRGCRSAVQHVRPSA